MFGLGRKKPAISLATGEAARKRMDAYMEINRRFSGVIPRSGVKASAMGLELSKILTNHFSNAMFDEVLIPICLIDKTFSSHWTQGDALARWYALGFVCLTYCSLTSTWNEALTAEVGNEVYDATVEFCWSIWAMPNDIRERVTLFLGQNIKNTTSSMRGLRNEEMMSDWLERYAVRMNGGSPPWEVKPNEEWTKGWSISDIALMAMIPRFDVLKKCLFDVFNDTGGSILKIVSGEERGVVISNAPSVKTVSDVGPTPDTKIGIADSDQRGPDNSFDPRLETSQHPTEGQMRELWEAWEQSGEVGLLELLKKRGNESC